MVRPLVTLINIKHKYDILWLRLSLLEVLYFFFFFFLIYKKALAMLTKIKQNRNQKKS